MSLNIDSIHALEGRHSRVIETLKKHCFDYNNALELVDVNGPTDPESPRACLEYLQRCLNRPKSSYRSATCLYRVYRPAFDQLQLPDELIDLVLDYRFIRNPWDVWIHREVRSTSIYNDHGQPEWQSFAIFWYQHSIHQSIQRSGQMEILSKNDFQDNYFVQQAYDRVQAKRAQYACLIQPLVSGDWNVSSHNNQKSLRLTITITQAQEKQFKVFSDSAYAYLHDCSFDEEVGLARNENQECGFMHIVTDQCPNRITAIVLFFEHTNLFFAK